MTNQPNNGVVLFKALMEKKKDDFIKQAPKNYDVDTFLSNMIRLYGNNSSYDAKACLLVANSILALGLNPHPAAGQVYIVNFGGIPVMMVTQQGWASLFNRYGITLNTQVVYTNDTFEASMGDMTIKHIRARGDRGTMEAVYSIAYRDNAPMAVEVMTLDECNKIKELAPSGKSPSSPWNKHFDEMCRKTVIKRMAKRIAIDGYEQVISALDYEYATEGYDKLKPVQDVNTDEQKTYALDAVKEPKQIDLGDAIAEEKNGQ